MLYALSKPLNQVDGQLLVNLITANDVLILIQDGVVNSVNGSQSLQQLLVLPCPIFALNNDIQARGLSSLFSKKITACSLDEFVELTEKHTPYISW